MMDAAARTTPTDSPVITVRGVRRAAFVEFEYSLANGELAVELIMPLAALQEFRSARRAELRFADAGAERSYNELLSAVSGSRS